MVAPEFYSKLAQSAAGLLGPAITSFLKPPLPVPIPMGLVVVLALEARKRLKSRSLLSMPTGKVEDALIRINDEVEKARKELRQATKTLEEIEKGTMEGKVSLARQAVSNLQGKLDEVEDTQTILNLLLLVKRRLDERKSIYGEGILKKLDKHLDKVQDKKMEEVIYNLKERELNVKEFSEYLNSMMKG